LITWPFISAPFGLSLSKASLATGDNGETDRFDPSISSGQAELNANGTDSLGFKSFRIALRSTEFWQSTINRQLTTFYRA
jgi:hypothetical protein